MILKSIFLFFLCLSLFSCQSLVVNSDYNTSYDFTPLKTFALITDPPKEVGDLRFDSPLMHDRIKSNILLTLNNNGFEESPDKSQDFNVKFHIITRSETQINQYPTAYYSTGIYAPHTFHHNFYYPFTGMETEVTHYEVGSVVIDIIDAKTNKLIWRGWGDRRISNSDNATLNDINIKKTIQEILTNFPPKIK